MRFEDRPHRRFNPLKGEWLLVSPHRAKRPWQGQQDEPANRLVALLQSVIGDEGGARMTDGGFGGACVAVLPAERVADVAAAVEAGYRTPDGERPLVMVERPGPGVSLL